MTQSNSINQGDTNISSNSTKTGLVSWDSNQLAMLNKLSKWVNLLQTSLNNEESNYYNNMPVVYVDPAVVAGTGMIQNINEFLNNPPQDVTFRVEFIEGFPTVAGTPIWERLEGELPNITVTLDNIVKVNMKRVIEASMN